MKIHLLSIAFCAALAGCVSYVPYYYPRYVVYPAGAPQNPNAVPQAQDPNAAQGAPQVVVPSPYTYAYGYPVEQYAYPYGYAYPYAYPYGYPYYYGAAWVGAGWWCCGGGGGHYGHGHWNGGGGGHWNGGGGGGGQWHTGGGMGGGSHGGRR